MARATRDEWKRRVARWRDSGLTAKEFAESEGLNATTLSLWRLKLGSSPGRASVGTPGTKRKQPRQAAAGLCDSEASFVGFELLAGGSSGPELEVVLDAGIRIRVPSGFDELALQRLVDALRGTVR